MLVVLCRDALATKFANVGSSGCCHCVEESSGKERYALPLQSRNSGAGSVGCRSGTSLVLKHRAVAGGCDDNGTHLISIGHFGGSCGKRCFEFVLVKQRCMASGEYNFVSNSQWCEAGLSAHIACPTHCLLGATVAG